MTIRYLTFSILISLLILVGCTYYPHGMTEYSDYVPITDDIGILARLPGKGPEMVLSHQFGFNLLIDERIIGSWHLQSDNNQPDVLLSNDGTASLTIPSRSTKSGEYQWVTGNIIFITYSDGSSDALRFDFIDDQNAIISISGDKDMIIILGRKNVTDETRRIASGRTS